jgi:SAM-dependent methyltransferase
MSADDVLAQMKAGQKMMWSLGDYEQVAPRLAVAAEALADRCGLGPGMGVLDVAAGNGNFAVAAARRGAQVIASDLSPRMIELGRARTADLDIEWREADAEALAFDTASFDVVASVFGAMFAPRPEMVASELMRVARPGGLVAMANYAPTGFLGSMSEAMRAYAGPAPMPLPSPFTWGEAEEVRRRLGPLSASIEIEPAKLRLEDTSLDGVWAFWEHTNQALIALRARLPEADFARLVEDCKRTIREQNLGDAEHVRLESDYLLVLARKLA